MWVPPSTSVADVAMDDPADERRILEGALRQERSGEVRGRRATPLVATENPCISLLGVGVGVWQEACLSVCVCFSYRASILVKNWINGLTDYWAFRLRPVHTVIGRITIEILAHVVLSDQSIPFNLVTSNFGNLEPGPWRYGNAVFST